MRTAVKLTGKTDSFPVVAVGASAGGLEAFTHLLSALPDTTGMGFVFVQHLDPRHHSMLSELLAKKSSMPVVEAKDGTRVEPNHVYVIPPNVNMGILGRRLQLTPRVEEAGQHTPVDFFMRSLAEARNSHSIGVVLSGTASDGTRGLAAIKAEGGITFAQDEKSAKYNGMPHSAIVSGCVDFVLPPAKIAQELARISGHPYLSGDAVEARPGKLKKQKSSDDNFEKVFALLRTTCGINFREYKPGTIQRRTLRRMALQKMDRVNEYTDYLETHPSETEALCQDLLIPVTSFFRDLEAFEALKNRVFPAILKDKTNKGTIRIWDPGCSTGEETYSLAIMLLEFLGDKASSFEIKLFGTDVNERGIEKARAGIYQERISQEISPDRLRRFFAKVDEGYRVAKTVRDLCVFAKHNLAEDPPFSQMNLVACRNLMIYFGPTLQNKIMPVLHYAMHPSGFLMLGNAESIAAFPNLFTPADKKHKIFTKKAVGTRLHYDFSASRYPREGSIPMAAIGPTETSLDSDRQHEADRVVLKNYAPPGVIINDNMEILQFRGLIGPYIEPSPGKASLHLLKIAREEFVTELRTAVNQAKKNHARVKRQPMEFRRNGQLKSVKISVEPLASSGETWQYLILFEPVSSSLLPRKAGGKVRGMGRTAKGEIAQLRVKLASAEEHLRSVIESKEASDEEYQSANEEILSGNEELQSTNEELETSKEELQSANEELNTVNDELHTRNIDLDRANSDLNNVLTSTSMPIVMVDRGLRIRRMTSASAKALKILPSDIGRPITDIRSDINVTNIDEVISGVIETLTPKEIEVQDKDHHWYSFQVRPYRTTDDKIDGAVLVLSDIDPLKRLNERLRKSKEFTDDIIDTVREPLAVLSKDLKVLYVNPSFLTNFKVNREDTDGQFLYRLGNEQWNIPKLRTVLEAVISKDTPLANFEVEHDFPKLGTKTMLLNARRIVDGHSDEPMMLLAIEDITERKRAEAALRESEVRFRSVFTGEMVPMGLWTKDGNIPDANAPLLRLIGYTSEELASGQLRWIDLTPPEYATLDQQAVAEVAAKGVCTPYEKEFIHKDGRRIPILIGGGHLEGGHLQGSADGIFFVVDLSERKQAEAALRDSEERFRHLANTIPQLAWMADSTGAVFWYNRGWYEYTGSTPEEMEGWGWQSVHDPDVLPKVLARWRESIATGKPFDMVFPLRRADGEFRPFLTRIAPMLDSGGNVVRWFGTNTDITEQRNAEAALETRVKERTAELEARNADIVAQAKQLQELSGHLMRVQDEQARKISRELHDSLGQYLAHAKMSLLNLKNPDATEKEAQKFSHLMDILEKCLTETRTISHLLHPPLLDEIGFASAAKWYVEGFSERSGIKATLNVPQELKRLPDALELALFRILQESLTNVHRYSESQSAEIQVAVGSDKITLQVRDYGQGVPPDVLERFKTDGGGVGVGLRGMRERIRELRGQFEIQSDKNGTLIRVTAPLSDR